MAAGESVAGSQFLYGGPFNTTVGAILASGATIAPTNGCHHVSGTSAVVTITPPWTGFTGKITLIPDAIFTWTAAGNIAIAGTAVVNKALDMIFDGSKWAPSYLS
jgi:hypothetical protein